jgi:hypothetical protein
MRRFVRLSLIGLVALVAVGFWLQQSKPAAQPAQKATVSEGACTSAGVSLVVDFGSNSDAPLIQRCVSNFEGTSWKLLTTAGLKVQGTEKYPSSFLCRINSYPDEATEKCIDTPGIKNGSWAFFIATDSGWQYSAFGAASHMTKCGTSEGWRYLLPNESLDTYPRAKPVITSCD